MLFKLVVFNFKDESTTIVITNFVMKLNFIQFKLSKNQ